MKGYCDKKGFPINMPWLSCLDAHIIIERFNSVLRGFANFYSGFVFFRKKNQCIDGYI
jgi:hypothetical protein